MAQGWHGMAWLVAGSAAALDPDINFRGNPPLSASCPHTLSFSCCKMEENARKGEANSTPARLSFALLVASLFLRVISFFQLTPSSSKERERENYAHRKKDSFIWLVNVSPSCRKFDRVRYLFLRKHCRRFCYAR